MLAVAAISSLTLALATPARGAGLEPVGTYASPVFVTSDPNDAARLFVVEQGGTIKLTTPGGTTTFLDYTSQVLSGGERGLLSMAFAPDYATSGRFYVIYTRDAPADDPLLGDIQLDELTASGDSADPDTARHVLTIDHSQFSNHNGGQLQFGPDARLYISTGDGGGSGDPLESGQDTDSLLGKILRIDPRQNGSDPYSVPADNPFVGTAGADEIWSYGLRNPWRFSFDRDTGALVIADVGQSAWEEIDYEPQSAGGGRGDNFGWDCREGRHDFELDAGCAGQVFTEPIFEYSHTGGNCSITGGYVVHDPGIPELAGRYVYADLCAGQVRSLIPGLPDAADDRSEGLSVTQPTTFGEDACGRVYVASLAGPVSRIVGDSPTDCTPPPPPAIADSDPDSPANDNHPELKGSAEAGSTVDLYTSPGCTGSPTAAGTAADFASPGLTVSVADDTVTTFKATATDAAGNTSACSTGFDYREDSSPPDTAIDGGPSGPTNDPTPTFPFHSSEASATFGCSVDLPRFTPCASPKILHHLKDGWHRFSVRAKDAAGNVDPSPATRAFIVRTAAVKVVRSTLTVVAAPGARDNLAITRPSRSTIRVTDLPRRWYPGSGIHTGAGCTRVGDHTANCPAAAISRVRVLSRDRGDRVVNSTRLESTLNGGAGQDLLVGGARSDTIVGGPQADIMRGMNGDDSLLARDLGSDRRINCDGGTVPGGADRAHLDLLPNDPAVSVLNCETTTRR